MTHNRRKIAGAIAVLSGLVLLAGCTGTDTLDTGILQLDIVLATENPTSTEWDCIQLELVTLSVLSLDGICDENSQVVGAPCHGNVDCLGGTCTGNLAEGIQAVPFEIPDGKLGFQSGQCPPELDLVGVPPKIENPIPIQNSIFSLEPLLLPTGLYRVDTVAFGEFVLADILPDAPATTCNVLDSILAGIVECYGICTGTAPATYDEDLIFRVEEGTTTIQLTLDLTEMESRIGFFTPTPACDVTNADDLLAIRFVQ